MFGKSLVVTRAFSRSRSRRTKTDTRYSWQEARAHNRTNGYCRAQKAGGDLLNWRFTPGLFDGDAQSCTSPRSEEQQPSKLKVAGSNPAGVATEINTLGAV